MQIKFVSDPSEAQPTNTRKKKRFRITVTASIVVDDDTFVDTEWVTIPNEDVVNKYEDEDGEMLEDVMLDDGVEYFPEEDCFAKPRNIAENPVDAQDIIEALTEKYDSTFEFIDDDEDIAAALQTFVVEVDDEGRPIGQARNQSETK